MTHPFDIRSPPFISSCFRPFVILYTVAVYQALTIIVSVSIRMEIAYVKTVYKVIQKKKFVIKLSFSDHHIEVNFGVICYSGIYVYLHLSLKISIFFVLPIICLSCLAKFNCKPKYSSGLIESSQTSIFGKE